MKQVEEHIHSIEHNTHQKEPPIQYYCIPKHCMITSLYQGRIASINPPISPHRKASVSIHLVSPHKAVHSFHHVFPPQKAVPPPRKVAAPPHKVVSPP